MKTQVLPDRPFVIMKTFSGVPKYYLGTVRAEGIEADFTANISAAFVYTWESAWRRIHKTPAFVGCIAIALPSNPVI
jgi:hypothetical protein